MGLLIELGLWCNSKPPDFGLKPKKTFVMEGFEKQMFYCPQEINALRAYNGAWLFHLCIYNCNAHHVQYFPHRTSHLKNMVTLSHT